MVTYEQVKLLESKVIKAVDCIRQLTEENSLLKGKLSGYEKRIDELEALITHFKEDQGRIEKGIISALERLDQFEDAIDSALNVNKSPVKTGQKPLPQSNKIVNDKTEKPSAEKPAISGKTIMPNLEAERAIEPELDSAIDDEEPQIKPGELDIF